MRPSLFLSSSSIRPLSVAMVLCVLIGITSCVPRQDVSDDIEALPLEVSKSDLSFANTGGSETVTVNTKSKWSFISNVPENTWLQLSQNGNNLEVSVTPNLSGDTRSASVIILAGRDQSKVTVTQSSADFVLDFSKEEVVFSSKGGLQTVDVTTNASSWTFEPIPEEANWLSIKSGNGAGVVYLEAAKNDSFDARTVNLIVTGKTGEKRLLSVKQMGVTKYFLPYEPQIPYRVVDLFTFEQNRGNILQSYSDPEAPNRFNPDGSPGYALYVTTSDYMPMISYVQNSLSDLKYSEVRMILVYDDPTNPVEMDDYIALLKDNGYNEVETQSDIYLKFLKNDRTMSVQYQRLSDGGILKFQPQYPQTKKLPTFGKLPEGPTGLLALLNKPDKKEKDVDNFETANGGHLEHEGKYEGEDNTQLKLFSTGLKGDEEAGYHMFFFYGAKDSADTPEMLNSIKEIAFFYPNPDLAIRTVGSLNFVTDEYEELLTAQGYSLIQSKDGKLFFYGKPVENNMLLIHYFQKVQYSDIYDGTHPALNVGYFYMPNPEKGASVRTMLKSMNEGKRHDMGILSREFLDAFTARHEAMHRK